MLSHGVSIDNNKKPLTENMAVEPMVLINPNIILDVLNKRILLYSTSVQVLAGLETFAFAMTLMLIGGFLRCLILGMMQSFVLGGYDYAQQPLKVHKP
jgi:hypothetical protein